ncbi:MAG: DUF5906 domain-containing protein [Planctomycetes bacterium]|nr:DUF5906 domain-containing protein [Planctomycetota bacterium]
MKLIISVSTLKRTVEAADLTAEIAIQLTKEIAVEPKGPVELNVRKFADWSPTARTVFFDLWAAVKQSRVVTAKVKKATYSEPLDFELSVLDDTPGEDEIAGWVTEAAAMVAVCYAETERAKCAAAVVKRLEEVGSTKLTEAEFLARVAEAAGDDDSSRKGGGGPNPTLLAADFLERQLATPTYQSLPSGSQTLHYFAGSFYAWDLAWIAIVPEEMRARVTRDLQDHSGVNKVTTALVSNVQLNLQGLCLVEGADQPLPFYIDEYGPPTQTTQRKMLAFQNGLIDLESVAAGKVPELQPHDSRWFGTSVLPFNYDPKAKCKQFKKFLYRILERDPKSGIALTVGDRRLWVLQEWFGYTLLCDARFQKFLLMVGEGSNGKGVIQNLWIRMLGQENVSHVSLDQLSERFALQPLLGKMANICGDLCEIDAVAEGVLKRLTGQDNITVDIKNRPPVTMAPSVKLIFGTNALPRFADKSRGVWRRLMAMPFRVVLPDAEQDETLTEKLTAELPGILNWAIAGLRRLLEQGHFSACVVCTDAARRHQLDCDPVAQFIDECGIHPPPSCGGTRWVLKDELYQEYSEWSENGGFKAKSKNSFNRQIGKLPGVAEHRSAQADPTGKRPYHWTGIGKLLPLPTPTADPEDEDAQAEDAA